MGWGERPESFLARQQRQRERWGELGVFNSSRDALSVNRRRTEEGRQRTNLGRAIAERNMQAERELGMVGGPLAPPVLSPEEQFRQGQRSQEFDLRRQQDESRGGGLFSGLGNVAGAVGQAASRIPRPVGLMTPETPATDFQQEPATISSGEAISHTLTGLDRPRGAVFGLAASSPEFIRGDLTAPLEQGAAGFAQPEELRGIDTPYIRDLPDRGLEVGPVNLTPRTVAGAALEAAGDPFIALPGAKGAAAAARVGERTVATRAPGPIGRTFAERVLERRGQRTITGAAEEVPQFTSARQELLETLAEDARRRRVGATGREISAGRQEQFRRAGGAVEDVMLSGGSASEAVRSARGAAAGPLTHVNPLPISERAHEELIGEIVRQYRSGGLHPGEMMRATEALQMRVNGLRAPQPAEIELLQRVFGPETARALADEPLSANLPRPPTSRGRGTPLPSTEPTLPRTGARLPAGPQRAPAPDVMGARAWRAHLDDAFPPPRPEPPASFRQRVWDVVLDVLGFPRAVLASFDLSAPNRQGFLFIGRKEWWQAWAPQIKAFASESYARAMDVAIKDDMALALKRLYRRIGIEVESFRDPDTGLISLRRADGSSDLPFRGPELTVFEGAGKLGSREEGFFSRLAEKVPGIRNSQRAFTTFLNKLRADYYMNRARRLEALFEGGQLTPEQFIQEIRMLDAWTNIASARANLPARVAHSDLLTLSNQVWFSARLNVARFQALQKAGEITAGRTVTGGRFPRYMRREIARDFVTAIGTGTGVLAVGNQLGWWTIELDPRSSDFAKGRAGPVRYDPWGGFQQVVRVLAQMATGERKATASGLVSDVDRRDILTRYFRSKLNPGAPAIVVDLWTGETFIGDDFELGNQPRDRFLPLSIGDIMEAYELGGLGAGAATVLPAALGLGIVAFENVGDVQNQIAQERYGLNYTQLNKGQRDAVNDDERVSALIDEIDRELGSPQQQVAATFANWERVQGESEVILRAKLDAGMDGRALRDAVRDFKSERFVVGNALFNNPTVAEEIARIDQPVEDVLAERYWSAELPEDLTTGRLDFASRDLERAAILSEAERLGIEVDYITGSGEGTYRGKRFDDAEVRAAIEHLESLEEQLEDSRFYDIRDRVWQRVADQFALEGFATEADFRDEVQRRILVRLTEQGITSGKAVEIANDIYNRMPMVEAWRQISNDVEEAWLRANPELADEARFYGYIGNLRQSETGALLEASLAR